MALMVVGPYKVFPPQKRNKNRKSSALHEECGMINAHREKSYPNKVFVVSVNRFIIIGTIHDYELAFGSECRTKLDEKADCPCWI